MNGPLIGVVRVGLLLLGALILWAGWRSRFDADRVLFALAGGACVGVVVADIVLWWPQ